MMKAFLHKNRGFLAFLLQYEQHLLCVLLCLYLGFNAGANSCR